MVQRAFTMLELLVVIGIIMVLIGLSFPLMAHMRLNADIKSTRMLVNAVHAAVLQYGHPMVTGTDGKGYNAWTLNWNGHPNPTDGQQPLDGDPLLYSASDPITTIAPSFYRGFVFMTQFPVDEARLDGYHRVVDRWRQPLQIAYASETYGQDGFGIWSMGPDKTNYTSDDIQSWTNDTN